MDLLGFGRHHALSDEELRAQLDEVRCRYDVALAALRCREYQTAHRWPVSRPLTEEELAEAAWANLAVDRPDLTLDEVRRILLDS